MNASGEAGEGYDTWFFERFSKLEANNFWFCARNRLIVWALRRYFPAVQSFLEIGCGTGFVLAEIERTMNYPRIAGMDLYQEGLSCVRRRVKKAELFQADIRKFSKENEFDLIGAFDVLEHIQEDEDALKRIYAAVRKGGGLIITVPQHKFLWSSTDAISFHARRYEAAELKEKIERAGFKVKDMVPFVSLLMPFALLRRLIKFKSLDEKGVFWELKLPRVLNWIFEQILNFELFLIKMNLRFPFGSSLLVVAKKE